MLGVSFKPQAAQAIFHHVSNNPVRRKQLRCRRYFFLGNLDVVVKVLENFRLGFRVVILVKPTDNLHGIFPVFFGNVVHEPAHGTVWFQQVIWEKEFRVVRNPLEHARQQLVQRVALRNHQVLEEFAVLVVFLERIDLLHVEPVHLQVDGLGHNLRLEGPGIVAEHANMARQVVVHLHKAERAKAVEPGVGHFFYHLLKTLAADFLNQGRTLLLFDIRKHAPVHRTCVRINSGVLTNAIP